MKITEFGNPILRQKAHPLSASEIKSPKTQKLIEDMREFLTSKKLGVGLAAPQIGESIALAIVSIRPLKHRKDVKEFDLVIINPEILEVFGRKIQQWEGCISAGPAKSGLFARVPRYKKIRLKYYDEKGASKNKIFEGLPAHIIQHEVDHLNGVLFVDRVKDKKTFVTYKEYLKIVKRKKLSKKD